MTRNGGTIRGTILFYLWIYISREVQLQIGECKTHHLLLFLRILSWPFSSSHSPLFLPLLSTFSLLTS